VHKDKVNRFGRKESLAISRQESEFNKGAAGNFVNQIVGRRTVTTQHIFTFKTTQWSKPSGACTKRFVQAYVASLTGQS
jgi:hypothetical protein